MKGRLQNPLQGSKSPAGLKIPCTQCAYARSFMKVWRGGGGGGKRGREEERGEDRLAGGESKLKEKNRSNSLSSPQDHADLIFRLFFLNFLEDLS